MDKEEIYVNLRVLQGLDKNQKLISRGSYLNVEAVSIIPEFFRRWHRQDNRNECLKKITLVVNSAIDYILKLSDTSVTPLNSNHWDTNKGLVDVESKHINAKMNDTNLSEINIMKGYLKDSLKGIQNLKETYATDTQTCARIDVIVNKINTILNGATRI